MNFQRTLSLQCPGCGATDFENGESQDPAAILECTSCHRTSTREHLIEDNAEFIEIQKQELVREATNELQKDLKRTLQDAFRGTKYIKFK